jgi:ammonia channel protein AmtB
MGTTGVLFVTLHKTVGLRVKHNEELLGLDVEEHGSPSYTGFVMESMNNAS